jgi:hypothetical protein
LCKVHGTLPGAAPLLPSPRRRQGRINNNTGGRPAAGAKSQRIAMHSPQLCIALILKIFPWSHFASREQYRLCSIFRASCARMRVHQGMIRICAVAASAPNLSHRVRAAMRQPGLKSMERLPATRKRIKWENNSRAQHFCGCFYQ